MSHENRYDVVVVGGGHNGLTTAVRLAKRGRKVLVLERRPSVGGLAGPREFHPGFRSPGVLHDTTCLRRDVVDDLGLRSHGLEFTTSPPPVYVPGHGSEGLWLHVDAARARTEIEKFSEADAQRYAEYRAFIERVRTFICGILDEVPPDVTSAGPSALWALVRKGLSAQRLGRRTVMELARIGPMCVADWLDEWFETDALKVALATPALCGAFAGPRSPGTAFNLLLLECCRGVAVKGGAPALVSALESAARANGVEIRTSVEVKEIRIASGVVGGVTLSTGESIDAACIAASCDPKRTFLDLVAGHELSELFTHRIEHYRCKGTGAKVHLAVKGAGLDGTSGDEVYARTGKSLSEIERAFDAVKYGRYSERPVFDIYGSASPVYAPQGHSTFSVLVLFVPYNLRGGWSQEAREALATLVRNTLREEFPGLIDRVVAEEMITPFDLEHEYGTTEGHIYHGEHAIDQLVVRPTPECARYATPVRGLFLCGSGAYAGGGVTCRPGYMAAGEMLRRV